MVHLLSSVQILSAILLTALILIQRANTDASGALGADGSSSTGVLKKRGGELLLHRLTIVTAIVFAGALALPLFIA